MTTLSSTPAAPVITSVACTTGGTLPVFQLTWQPQQGYTGPFVILVTKSDGTAVAGTGSSLSANGGTWTATDTMSATTDTYFVQVAVSGNEGIISDKVQLLFASPTSITTAYDGSVLTVKWVPAASATPTSQTEILLMTPAGVQAVQVTTSGFGQMTVAANLLGSIGDWSVILTPQYGICSGPSSAPATVYGFSPVITGSVIIGNQGNQAIQTSLSVTIQVWAPAQPAGNATIVLTALADGVAVVTSAPPTNSGWTSSAGGYTTTATAIINYPFDLGHVFQVAAALSSAIPHQAVGPMGLPVPLMLTPPVDISAETVKNGNDLDITFTITPFPGVPQATGNQISITTPDAMGSTGTPAAGLSQTITLTGPTFADNFSAYVRAIRGTSLSQWMGSYNVTPIVVTPSGTALPLITSIPQISAVTVDDGIATVQWAAVTDPGATGYLLSALVGGAVVASGVFSGTTGSLAVVEDGATFSIAAVSAQVTGAASTPLAAITAAPVSLAAAWTSTGTSCTLSWAAPTGAGATPNQYRIEIWSGGTVVHSGTSATTSYTVPAGVLTGAGGFSFRVAASATGTPALSGPWTETTALVSAAASGLVTRYDGATLGATWSAVEGATGYRVVLLEGGAESGNAWFTAATATSVALAFDSTKTYSIAVQATGPGSTGPAVSAAVFQAGIYPQFAVDTAPAVVPATQPSMAPYAIAIGLPQIFTSPPTAADLPSVAPFVLTEGTAPYAYTLTIDGTAGALPWSFTADAVRADLYTAYGTFLADLETLGATAIGLQTVQMAISRTMPQTYVETLLYAYDFVGGNGWVDLRPGMVLRVEYESYQTMGSAVPDQGYLNGFITSAVANYQISRSAANATGITTLDAFIGWLVAQGGTAVTQPPTTNRKQAGGGGLIDGGYPQMQQPFLRLVYPPSFPSTAQTGTPYPEFNALLLAAAKLSDLTTATTNIRSGRDAGANVGVLYFRGRTTLVPQIRVWVNGVEQLVPVGTTANEILAERGMEPSSAGLPLTGIGLLRGVGPAPAGSPASYDAGTANPVRLDWAPSANAGIAALPLLNGDRITLGTINGGGGVA